ncbi:MAG: WYL domain-containing protein, partial [Synergistaceae bacterium]|nr:WYL domain-containing protein [Synergistaceae bacterium]
MPKTEASVVISRVCELLRYMAERGDSGATFKMIRDAIYGDELPAASCRRNFHRDRKRLNELCNEKWYMEVAGSEDLENVEISYIPSTKRYVLKGACFFMLPMKFDEEEAYIMSAGIKLCRHFIKAYSASADRLSRKLRESIPGEVMNTGESLSEALTMLMPVSNTEDRNKDALRLVLDAIVRKRALRLTDYEGMNGEMITDVISPYFLYFKYHSWYVWAASSKIGRDNPGPYRLSRMRAIETLDGGYAEPHKTMAEMAEDLELDYHPAYRGKTFNVRLRISGNFVKSVQQTMWFKGAQIEPRPDGSIIYSVRLKGLEEIRLWIMRSLDSIEV